MNKPKYKLVNGKPVLVEAAEPAPKRYKKPRKPIVWSKNLITRKARAIGLVCYMFYRGSVAFRKRIDAKQEPARMTDAELARRVVQFVHRVMPSFTQAFGHELDDDFKQRIDKGDRNGGFEEDGGKYFRSYIDAVGVVLQPSSIDVLRELGITPVTTDKVSRRVKPAVQPEEPTQMVIETIEPPPSKPAAPKKLNGHTRAPNYLKAAVEFIVLKVAETGECFRRDMPHDILPSGGGPWIDVEKALKGYGIVKVKSGNYVRFIEKPIR